MMTGRAIEIVSGAVGATGAVGIFAQLGGASLEPAAQMILAAGLVLATLASIYAMHLREMDGDDE